MMRAPECLLHLAGSDHAEVFLLFYFKNTEEEEAWPGKTSAVPRAKTPPSLRTGARRRAALCALLLLLLGLGMIAMLVL